MAFVMRMDLVSATAAIRMFHNVQHVMMMYSVMQRSTKQATCTSLRTILELSLHQFYSLVMAARLYMMTHGHELGHCTGLKYVH